MVTGFTPASISLANSSSVFQAELSSGPNQQGTNVTRSDILFAH